jgi:hypothetical protein
VAEGIPKVDEPFGRQGPVDNLMLVWEQNDESPSAGAKGLSVIGPVYWIDKRWL